jgi:mannose-6-phosphate isomerase-like protein (cupin superfamily)
MNKSQAFVVKPNEPTPLRMVGERVQILASAERTGSVEVFLQAGNEGAGPPPHTHAWDEAYYVLEGRIDVLLGDRVVALSGGDFVFVPGGTPHNFQMKAPGTRFLSMNSRAGASSFFVDVDREVGEAMDIPKLVDVANRHEVFLAPPPGAAK